MIFRIAVSALFSSGNLTFYAKLRGGMCRRATSELESGLSSVAARCVIFAVYVQNRAFLYVRIKNWRVWLRPRLGDDAIVGIDTRLSGECAR